MSITCLNLKTIKRFLYFYTNRKYIKTKEKLKLTYLKKNNLNTSLIYS